jgi:L-fuculose-phosphate aldolase
LLSKTPRLKSRGYERPEPRLLSLGVFLSLLGIALLLAACGGDDKPSATATPDNIALFDLHGGLIEGNVAPVGGEIIQMHAIVYRTRPEFQSVIHTHSPFATGFAVAGKIIPPAYEALVRNGMIEGVPLAGYGPRGSDQSVRNIETQLKSHDRIKGVLLENHGVLCFADNVNGAIRANMTIEESAEIIMYSYNLGGPKALPSNEIEATNARAAPVAAAGSYSSEQTRT